MIHRFRRRSVARNVDSLAEVPRLNFVQRTKSFLRSNFSSPPLTPSELPDSAAKCLDSQRVSPEATNMISRPPNGSDNGNGSGINRGKLVASKKANIERAQMSTFVNASSVRGETSCNLDVGKRANDETVSAGIRTLNTRLSKPSHLKSLAPISNSAKQVHCNANQSCENCNDSYHSRQIEPGGCIMTHGNERNNSFRRLDTDDTQVRRAFNQRLATVNGRARMQTIRSIDESCDQPVKIQ